MDLVGECLDKLVVDRDGAKAGRVDGIVLNLTVGKPPKVAFVELGPAVQARRLPRWASRCVQWMICRCSGADQAVARIAFEQIKLQRNEVVVPLDVNQLPGGRLEHWVRGRIIKRIPGA
jgi:hypothetical protein